jgi:hypothetical protein
MTLALTGLACGMGAEHPRFSAENPTQVAGSYGGVAFMVLAVLYILATIALLGWSAGIYVWHDYYRVPIPAAQKLVMAATLLAALLLSLYTFATAMRRGVRALEALG